MGQEGEPLDRAGKGRFLGLPPQLPVVDRVVFAIGETAYTWRDVVHFAWRRGDWRELVRETEEGVTGTADATRHGTLPPPDRVAAAVAAFRRERRLLAGSDYQSWLAERDLTVADCTDWARRCLVREAGRAAGDTYTYTYTSSTSAAPDATDVSARLWPTGVLSGRLARWAEDLAARAAAFASLSEPGEPADPVVLEHALTRFSEAAATRTALERSVAAHQLDWILVEGAIAEFAREDAAREAILCVRHDGADLGDVAKEAGNEFTHGRWLLEDLPESLRPGLAAALPGDVIGPTDTGHAHVVAVVSAKTYPSVEDSCASRRATEEVVARAIAALVDDRVVWRVAL